MDTSLDFGYVKAFQKMALGLFAHFGLYSITGRGEWYLHTAGAVPDQYEALAGRFHVKRTWAQELVRTAKAMGARYITLTARHHDGFSLYDTCGMNAYDAPHSACGRDLIAEFADACRAGGIVPFFYHTLLDWRMPSYRSDFPAYLAYLRESIGLLCRNYGEVGGFWFDGMWDRPDEDWQEDALYSLIRKYQQKAMIINNTGLSARGAQGHPQIDSVTFERGTPKRVTSGRPRASEMCQVLNDHWGYARSDCNYKSVASLIGDLIDCRANGSNYLLNTGLRGNGSVDITQARLLREFGKWVRRNGEFVYDAEPCNMRAQGAQVLRGRDCWFAAVKDVPMCADPNVAASGEQRPVILDGRMRAADAVWLDNGERAHFVQENVLRVAPFAYGTSLYARIAKIKREERL